MDAYNLAQIEHREHVTFKAEWRPALPGCDTEQLTNEFTRSEPSQSNHEDAHVITHKCL